MVIQNGYNKDERRRGVSRLPFVLAAAFLGKAILLFILLPYFQTASPQDYAAGSFPDNYDQIAWNLVQGNGYRVYADTSLTMLRTPGFVFVLALVFSLFGKSLVAVQVLHLCFSGLTAAIIFRLARLGDYSVKAGLIAAGIFFFYPGVIIAESRGGLESTLTLCLAGLFWLSVLAMRDGGWKSFALVGASYGLTLLVKSSAAPVLPALYAYWLWRAPAGDARRRLFLRMALSAAIAALVVAPWVARNYWVSGRFVPTMTVSGLALFQGAYVVDHLESQKEHFEILNDAADEQLAIARDMGLRTREAFFPQFYAVEDEIRYYDDLGMRAIARYRADPELFLRGVGHNAWAFWLGGRTSRATLLNALLTLPLLALAFAGFVLEKKRCVLSIPIAIVIVSFMAPHLPILAMARYYIPLVPFLALLAATPLALLSDRLLPRYALQSTAGRGQ